MKKFEKRKAHIDAFLRSPNKFEIIEEADKPMIDGLHSMMLLSLDKMNDTHPTHLKRIMKHHGRDIDKMIGAKSINQRKKHMQEADLKGKGFWNKIGNFFTKTIPHQFDTATKAIGDLSDKYLDPFEAAKLGEQGLKKIGLDVPVSEGLKAIINAVPDNRLASVKAQSSY